MSSISAVGQGLNPFLQGITATPWSQPVAASSPTTTGDPTDPPSKCKTAVAITIMAVAVASSSRLFSLLSRLHCNQPNRAATPLIQTK